MITRKQVLLTLIVGAAICGIGFLVSDYYLGVVVLVLMWAFLAASWNVVGGFAGQHSFGHSLFMGIGAYAVAYLGTRGMNPWLAAPIAIAAAGAVGWLVGFATFRRHMTGGYYALATIAITEAMVAIVSNTPILGGASGLEIPLGADSLLRMQSAEGIYYLLAGVVLNVLMILGTQWLTGTRFYYQMMAVRENEDAAAALGVDVTKTKIVAAVLSAALTGVGGIFYVEYYTFVGPAVFSSFLAVQIMLYALVGGEGTVWGPLIGAAIIVPIAEYARGTLGNVVQGLDMILYGGILIAVMMFMPRGILGIVSSVRARRAAGRKLVPPDELPGSEEVAT